MASSNASCVACRLYKLAFPNFSSKMAADAVVYSSLSPPKTGGNETEKKPIDISTLSLKKT